MTEKLATADPALDADVRCSIHRDIFDRAEGFYEALPVLGGVLRAIKRRI